MANWNEVIVNLGAKVGPQALTDGTLANGRADRTGALVVQQGHGKYFEAAIRGRLFYSHCAARAMSAPATSAIGNIVWNPPGSGMYLVFGPWDVTYLVDDADARAVNFCYSVQAALPGSVTAADASGPCLVGAVGSSSGVAKCYAIATVTTAATPIRTLIEIGTAKLSLGTVVAGGDLDGSIIIPPGYLASLHTIAAAGAAGVSSTLVWEEIPI